MNKAIIKVILIVSLFLLLFYSHTSINSFAAGDGNADSGGGYGGGDTIPGYTEWKGGSNYEGVRVTILNCETGMRATGSADFSNGANILYNLVDIHFGKADKRLRHMGAGLNMWSGGYVVYNLEDSLPRIIGSRGNIEAVKAYFCDEERLEYICSVMNFNYDTLIDGGYKILFEPIMYFHYQGLLIAATATERAMMGGDFMPTTTRERLPLSAFLEFDEPEFGFYAWQGATSGVQTLDNMFTYLGMGIIRFRGEPIPPAEPIPSVDFLYRTDTWVYTYVDIINNNSYGFPHSPYKFNSGNYETAYRDNRDYGNEPLLVTFHTPSGNETYELNIGAGSEGRAFVKWKTPKAPVPLSEMNVTVNKPANISFTKPKYIVVELPENIPPDPEARDRFDNFRTPTYEQVYDETYTTWKINEKNGWYSNMQLKYIGVYTEGTQPGSIGSGSTSLSQSGVTFSSGWATVRGNQTEPPRYGSKHRQDEFGNYLYYDDGAAQMETDYGNMIEGAKYRYFVVVDTGYWLHRRDDHSARIFGTLNIKADETVPTLGGNSMRSGYGFNALAEFTTNNPTYCTNIQNVMMLFPEFNYDLGFNQGAIRAPYPLDGRYFRWLEPMPIGSGRFEFYENAWSTYGNRVHYTPVWYPDGSYTVRADCFDAWTPGGQLAITLSDTIGINGSVFDDWHVAPGW